MAFIAELADLNGAAKGQPAWRGLTIEQALNGGLTASLTIDASDATAAEARIGQRVLRVWEGTLCAFMASCASPLSVSPAAFS